MSEAGTTSAPSPPATVEDLAQRYPALGADQRGLAGALLADAWSLVQVQAPSATAYPAAPLLGQVLRQVLCAMVARVLRNPDGVRQTGIDDYQVTLDPTTATGALYVAPGELAAIRGAARAAGQATTSSAGSVRLHAPSGAYTRWDEREDHYW